MTNDHLSPGSEDAILAVDVEAAASCCSVAQQATCCEPRAKSACCGAETTAGGGCGCQ